MSELKFTCPDCGQHIAADSRWSGLQVSCPTCRAPFIVPGEPGLMACVETYAGEPAGQTSTAICPRPGAAVKPRHPVSKLAILSLAFCLSGILIVPGLICGHCARRRIKRDSSLRGKGIALAGLIIGYTSLALILVLLGLPVVLLLRHEPQTSVSGSAAPDAMSTQQSNRPPESIPNSGSESVTAQFVSLEGPPGSEIITIRLKNLTNKAVCEVTLQYTYCDAQGQALRVSPVTKALEPVLPGNSTQEVSGMAFPPKGTEAVQIRVMKACFADGAHWQADNLRRAESLAGGNGRGWS